MVDDHTRRKVLRTGVALTSLGIGAGVTSGREKATNKQTPDVVASSTGIDRTDSFHEIGRESREKVSLTNSFGGKFHRGIISGFTRKVNKLDSDLTVTWAGDAQEVTLTTEFEVSGFDLSFDIPPSLSFDKSGDSVTFSNTWTDLPRGKCLWQDIGTLSVKGLSIESAEVNMHAEVQYDNHSTIVTNNLKESPDFPTMN